jgi:hypothetical protein
MRTIVEDVAQVGTGAGAQHLGARHERNACISLFYNVLRVNRCVERGPAAQDTNTFGMKRLRTQHADHSNMILKVWLKLTARNVLQS